MSKKELLFVYPQMMMGGSTTSLLSLFENIDYDKYNVDLLLLYSGGPLASVKIDNVNVLPYGHKYQNRIKRLIRRILSIKYMTAYFKSKIIAKRSGNARHGAQYLSSADVDFYRDVKKHYDVAIGFLEGYSVKYVAKRVSADRKLGWFHLDYAKCGSLAEYDRECVSLLDATVLVSDECEKSFKEYLPEFADKTVVIENILTRDYIRKRATEEANDLPDIDENKINFVSSCRVDFKSKGLDRVVNILISHKDEKIWDKFCWYIIGDGPDFGKLKAMIEENDLGDRIKLLGIKTNPLPYEKIMDMFLLPSRFEGKPMAVTEAFMIGLPVIVTEYLSAKEQITVGFDGIIASNDGDEDLYIKLKGVLNNPSVIQEMKDNIKTKDYSNIEEIEKVEKLIDGE